MTGVTSLTPKGQATIPKAIREELGLRPYDKITIFLENGEVKLRKAYPSLREFAGILPDLGIPVEDMPEIAKDERAERFAETLG